MYFVRFSFPSSKINKPDDTVVMFCGKQFHSDLLLISHYSIHHVKPGIQTQIAGQWLEETSDS